MRINLNCPFSEKDTAKALGARWDADKRVWYLEGIEDITPFMQWIPKHQAENPAQLITLAQYQSDKYAGACHALSHVAAKAFGIPYPLEAGWFKKYKNRTAPITALDAKPSKGKGKRHQGQKRQALSKGKITVSHHAPNIYESLPYPPWISEQEFEYEAQSVANALMHSHTIHQ
jgi:hypothetical protein